MAVWTVGPTLGAYLDHQTAYADALAAVDHGAEIRTVEDGVYAGQVLDMSGLNAIRLTRANGVDCTIGLDTSGFYAFTISPGMTVDGVKISGKTNRTIYSTGGEATFNNVTFYLESGTAGYMFRSIVGGTFNLTSCSILGDVQSVTWMFILFDGSEVHLNNVFVSDNITVSGTYGMVYAYDGVAASITMRGTNSPSSNLLKVRITSTVASLVVDGAYAPHLVSIEGAVTAFAGGYNVYNTTDAGTTSAGDVSGVTDFQVDANGTPLEGSPLIGVIPVGVDVGTSSLDAYGNPRISGPSQDVGPVERQVVPDRYLPVGGSRYITNSRSTSRAIRQ